MNVHLTSLFALVGMVLLAAVNTAPADDKEDAAKAEKAVKDELAKYKGGNSARVDQVKDEAVSKSFQGYLFFSARFPQFPVARILPEGLSASNVFAVDKDNKVQLLKDTKGLEEFFKGKLPSAKDDATAKDAARAWVRLSQELKNDGFYVFALMDEATKVTEEKGNKVASAKVVAMKGGNGEISVALTFDDAGKLAKLAEKSELKPGPRPICQATKLLDNDPIVRRMAEQDLLIMGRAARDYLDEQRAKAAPELRRAIDALWQRIVAEDR